MFRPIAVCLCTALVTLASSVAVNPRLGPGQANSLSIHQDTNITDLENLILYGPKPDLQSSEPQCLELAGTPPLSSCMEAVSLLPRDRNQVIFGQRRSASFVDHVMPYDFISSDGLCAIRVYTGVQGYNRETIFNTQLAQAVDTILDTCLEQKQRGGFITGLGDRGSLQVGVTFNIDVRPIRCSDTSYIPPTEKGCSTAVNTVPVTPEKQTFGPKDGRGVDVILPLVFRERRRPNIGCVVAIESLGGHLTTASWLLWYSAANTINAMCVRKGKEGRYIGSESGIVRTAVMAGIGEASAILAVAHIGITLSTTLIAYVGEVQDAPFRIQRIGNEILTTSERLKDIGELVEANNETQTLSGEGIQSAVRCSDDCGIILNQLRGVLKKGGWQQGPDGQGKEEIDISLFSSMRWPFSKSKIEVTLAELTRAKLDLMLLFSSAMAIGASSASEKAKYRKIIPGLSRTREWAALMLEEAKERARDPAYSTRPRDRSLNVPDAEPDMLREFVDFQERRIQEEEELRLKERAARLLVEQEQSNKKAEDERQDLEKTILDKYKKDQADLEARTAEQKEGLRKELETAGLGPEQIDVVLASSNLVYGGTHGRLNQPAGPVEIPDNDKEVVEKVTGRASRVPTSREHESWWKKLPWKRSRAPRSETSSVESKSSHLETERASETASETWILNAHLDIQPIQLKVDDDRLLAKFEKLHKNGHGWEDLTRLHHVSREHMWRFLDTEKPGWSLGAVEVQKLSRFGSSRDGQWVMYTIFPPEQSVDSAGDLGATKNPQHSHPPPPSRPVPQDAHAPPVSAPFRPDYYGPQPRYEGVDMPRNQPPPPFGADYFRPQPRYEGLDLPGVGPPPPPNTLEPYPHRQPLPYSINSHNYNPEQDKQAVLRGTENSKVPSALEPYHYRAPPPGRNSNPDDFNRSQNRQMVVQNATKQIQPRGLYPSRFSSSKRSESDWDYLSDHPSHNKGRNRQNHRDKGARRSSVERERREPGNSESSDLDWKIRTLPNSTRPSLEDERDSGRATALIRYPQSRQYTGEYIHRPRLADSEELRDDHTYTTQTRERPRRTSTSTEAKHKKRHKVPAHRRGNETSDEDYNLLNDKSSKQSGSGAKPSDEELISKALQKFTTFQPHYGRTMTDDFASRLPSKFVPGDQAALVPFNQGSRSAVEARRASDLRSPVYETSSRPIDSEPPVPREERHGRPRKFIPVATVQEEGIESSDSSQEQESSNPDKRFSIHDPDTTLTAEKPRPKADHNNAIDVAGSDASQSPNESGQGSSAKNMSHTFQSAGADTLYGQASNHDTLNSMQRRVTFRKDEGLARDLGKSLIKRSTTEPMSRMLSPPKRSATVEDFEPEADFEASLKGREV
ncbi:MAG: hypothetical protein Q9169_004405 [Polycauliona sp. 2 TL-2023]